MHELGIAFELIDTLKGVCEKNHIKRLLSVTLKVGEASMVVPDYMMECWEAAVQDTDFKDTKLKMVKTIAKGRCNQCGYGFNIAKNDRKCPHCGAYDDFVPISGMDIEISKVEAE
jgi:hydrogenase nickel incorporation protein HypA/HybF